MEEISSEQVNKPEESLSSMIVELTATIKKEMKDELDKKAAAFEAALAEHIKKQEQLNETVIKTMNELIIKSIRSAQAIQALSQSNGGLLEFCSGLEQVLKTNTPLTHDNLMAGIDAILSEKKKKMVDDAVKAGQIENADVVDDKSLVVVKEIAPDGKVLSSRTNLDLSRFPAELKAKVLGQKVGGTIVLAEDGNKFEVLEIYKPVPPKPPAKAPAQEADAPKAEAQPANEAPAEASASK